MNDLIFQEIIPSSLQVLKVYNILEKIYIDLSNPLDLDSYNDLERINAAIVLKDINDSNKLDLKKEKKLFHFLHEELKKYGLVNYGIDLVKTESFNTYYLLDLNPDTFSWLRYQNSSEILENYQKKLVQLYHTLNKN